jgi:hypothetical protein
MSRNNFTWLVKKTPTIGSNEINSVSIYNTMGKQCSIADIKKGSDMLQLNVKNLSNGLYFIKACFNDGNCLTSKFNLNK